MGSPSTRTTRGSILGSDSDCMRPATAGSARSAPEPNPSRQRDGKNYERADVAQPGTLKERKRMKGLPQFAVPMINVQLVRLIRD